jgi:hypothetical protein
MNNTFSILIAIVVILFLLIVAPFLTIWSLNTLFPVLEIPYTFETWSATILLTAVLQSSSLSFKNRK